MNAVTPVLGSLLVISILFAIGVFIGFVLIIIPGLILLTIWSVVVPVEVLEHRGIIGSFEPFARARARQRLERVRRDRDVFVAAIVVSFLVGLLAAPLGHVGRDIVQWAVNVAIAPVVALSATVLYLELRRAHTGPSPDPVSAPDPASAL